MRGKKGVGRVGERAGIREGDMRREKERERGGVREIKSVRDRRKGRERVR